MQYFLWFKNENYLWTYALIAKLIIQKGLSMCDSLMDVAGKMAVLDCIGPNSNGPGLVFLDGHFQYAVSCGLLRNKKESPHNTHV